jgi:hypothetical protein
MSFAATSRLFLLTVVCTIFLFFLPRQQQSHRHESEATRQTFPWSAGIRNERNRRKTETTITKGTKVSGKSIYSENKVDDTHAITDGR